MGGTSFSSDRQIRRRAPDHVRHVARRQMGIVLVDHAGVGMAERPGHHDQRRAGSHHRARVVVPQLVHDRSSSTTIGTAKGERDRFGIEFIAPKAEHQPGRSAEGALIAGGLGRSLRGGRGRRFRASPRHARRTARPFGRPGPTGESPRQPQSARAVLRRADRRGSDPSFPHWSKPGR